MFRKLMSFDEAKKVLNQNFIANPVGVEKVSLSVVLNRVLAQNVSSSIDIPSFNRSTVDGYAVKAADTFEAAEEKPIKLKFCGHVAIGELPRVIVENGLAAEIVTGAPLPQGADSVVMIEYTTQQEDTIFVHRPVSISENIMTAGSDIHKNEKVLEKGQVLDSRRIGVLAALGLTEIPVYKNPKVAILSTGEEIVEPGKPLSSGKIYDINAHTLSAAVKEIGGEPINLGIIPDNKEMLTKALEKALNLADVVLTSGGVSVGPKDITPKVVNSLGKPGVIISGVAVKPGKPLTISVVNKKIIFSLPGNPTSSLFMFNMFIHPILTKLAGRPEEKRSTIKAITAKKMFPARGRRTFIMVNLTCEKSGKIIVNPVPTGLSGAITTLSKADGFIEISEKRQFLDEGEEIEVYLLGKILKS